MRRGPIDGRIKAGEIAELKGRYVHEGEALNITVARTDVLHVFAMVDQKDAALAFYEKPSAVQVRAAGDRGHVIKGEGVKVVRWQPGISHIAKYGGRMQARGRGGPPPPHHK